VSGDSPTTQAKFAAKLELPFKLLTDKGLKLWQRFGVRMDKDKQIKRITFVINKQGVVRLAYYYTGRGDVTDHAREALKALQSATAGGKDA
jgi:peroxiredoxin Q/BCP